MAQDRGAASGSGARLAAPDGCRLAPGLCRGPQIIAEAKASATADQIETFKSLSRSGDPDNYCIIMVIVLSSYYFSPRLASCLARYILTMPLRRH